MPELTSMPAAEAITGGELIPALQGGGAVGLLAAQIAQAPRGAVLLARAPFAADMSSTSAGDPGAGALRWDHSTPSSASHVFLSDVDTDEADHGAVWADLPDGGRLYVQRVTENGITAQQVWTVTSVSAETGYVDLGVSLLAAHGSFADHDALQVSLQAAGVGVADAEDVAYDNTASGLGAVHVKAAIDELAARSSTGQAGVFNILDFRGPSDPDDGAAFQAALAAVANAGGGIIDFPVGQGTGPNGEFDVGGALQDTENANAQIVLPKIDVLTGDQITIVLRGSFPPCPDISVIGDLPVSLSGSILQSTLTSGSGGNFIGSYGPTGSAGTFTNLHLVLQNLTVRMPNNPTHTAVDVRRVACVSIDQVVIDSGSYYIEGLDEPTTSSSYGLRMPRQNNGALSRLGTVNVVGFYNGFEFAEHGNGYACQAAWGCKRGFVFTAAQYHASIFERLMGHHCQRVLVAEGQHFVRIGQVNIEHAGGGWWTTVYAVDDASNHFRGDLYWHAVLANSGLSNSFPVNGGDRLTVRQIGAANDGISGLIAAPADKSYKLVVKAPHRGRIVETTTICTSGTCTATFKINATALGGTANSVSTTEESRAHSSANVFAAGDDIVVTVSDNSSCVDLSFCVRYQRL